MENLREDNGEFKKIQNIILGSVIETTKPYLVPTVIEDWCQNLEEVNIEKAQKEFKNFVKLHKEEIERIKKENVKTLKCMGF